MAMQFREMSPILPFICWVRQLGGRVLTGLP